MLTAFYYSQTLTREREAGGSAVQMLSGRWCINCVRSALLISGLQFTHCAHRQSLYHSALYIIRNFFFLFFLVESGNWSLVN